MTPFEIYQEYKDKKISNLIELAQNFDYSTQFRLNDMMCTDICPCY